jgi:hypothetical protein
MIDTYLRFIRRYSDLFILALFALALSGCAGTPVVTTASASCAALLPTSWRDGVPPPPLPDGDTVGDWVSFGDQAIGKLDVANGRTRDAIDIVTKCEARDAAAVKRATRGFWGRLFG